MSGANEEMEKQAFDDHYKKGLEHENHGRYKAACDEYQEAMINDPGNQVYIDAFERMKKYI